MNNAYLKGPGDFEPHYTPEPTDDQIIRAIRDHAEMVAKNAVKSFSMELQSALVALAKYDDSNELLVVLSNSAADLLYRGEVDQ